MKIDKSKYYFFRDLDHESNLKDGKTQHATGIVDEVYNEEETPSWKDLSVTFFDPFEQDVTSAWRTYKEVELFEVGEWEWKKLAALLDNIEALTNK